MAQGHNLLLIKIYFENREVLLHLLYYIIHPCEGFVIERLHKYILT